MLLRRYVRVLRECQVKDTLLVLDRYTRRIGVFLPKRFFPNSELQTNFKFFFKVDASIVYIGITQGCGWKLNFWIEGVVDESEGKISLFIDTFGGDAWHDRLAVSIVLRTDGDAHLFGHDYRLMVPAVRVEDNCSRRRKLSEN